jgi:DNA invertase Pin-like site-specific DNA recombinase
MANTPGRIFQRAARTSSSNAASALITRPALLDPSASPPLAEGIDATTPAGKLQMHILGAIAEFERGRIVERVRAGLARARAQGKRLGRPKRRVPALHGVAGLTVRAAAAQLGVSRSTASRWLRSQERGDVFVDRE